MRAFPRFLNAKCIGRWLLLICACSAPVALAESMVQNEPAVTPDALVVETVQPTSDTKTQVTASKPVAEPVRISDVSNWLVVLVTLLGIIVMIFALGWIIRRMGGLRAMGVRDMKVVAALPVGNRERVAVVQVQGKQFLLGITPQQITHLHTFEDIAMPEPSDAGNFLATFQGVMGNKNKTDNASRPEHEA